MLYLIFNYVGLSTAMEQIIILTFHEPLQTNKQQSFAAIPWKYSKIDFNFYKETFVK